MKRLLLLVSAQSYRSTAFCKAAERLEIEVVQAVDLPRELADYWHVQLGVPFQAPDLAVEHLVQYGREHPVDAIVAVDDGATIIAARVAEQLGLPHASPDSSLAARDKFVMRRAFAEAGVPTPEFRLTDDPSSTAGLVRFPCVVKPRRLSGSRGVIRANNAAELLAAFDRIWRIPEAGLELLVEDFIPGREVALEGLLISGKLRVLALFDKPDPLDGPFFEET
ncbi:MAG: ATP-grasp domain-containing protein, partial [Chloroflexi bacterium]|nr:ATP-grasp domain-containing protein [Chloroflexota bacterium]